MLTDRLKLRGSSAQLGFKLGDAGICAAGGLLKRIVVLAKFVELVDLLKQLSVLGSAGGGSSVLGSFGVKLGSGVGQSLIDVLQVF